nr:hypothetical protein [Tanacetum cinerariifolium]
MDTESEPFEGEARTPESPHIIAPPTCHVKESEGSSTSGARSTTARMAVRVPPVMSPGLSVGMEGVAAMSDSAFRKRFSSYYDSSPSPTLPVRKGYKGTSGLILDTDSEEDEEVEESSDSDSESEDVEDESSDSGTSDARSTSSDSTMLLSLDHPLTHTTLVLVPILYRTARMAVRVLPVMSPGISAGMEEVAAMSGLAFRKRFRSYYYSSPSSTLPLKKRYKGTFELILGIDSEEVEESSDSDSESEDVKDEGPTVEDEDPATEDEGLAARVKGLGVDDESYGLDGKSHGVDDEIHGLDDESYGIDSEGRGIESDGLGLGEEEEAVHEGKGSSSALEPRRSKRVSAFRHPILTTWTDLEDGMVYIDVPVYPPPAPPVQTPPSLEWTSGLLPISPSPFVVPLPISSPMIPLTVPSPIASPMSTSTTTILVDEDQFIEVGAQLELYRGILQDHTQHLDAMPPALFAKIDRDVRELYTRLGAFRDEILSQRYRFRSLEHEQERTAVTFRALWRPVLALEAWTALQRELLEMRDRVTVLEQERDCRER